MMMDERKFRILQAIIDDYILTAVPVGSRTISKKYDMGLSSATIRNEMSDLEELGYLDQPHVSAGRIPSAKAYRLYVDQLLKTGRIPSDSDAAVKGHFLGRMHQMEDVIDHAAQVLSSLTSYTAMVLPPTVCGYFLLLIFGTKRPIGILLMQLGIKFVMTWYGGILAAAVVAFPLMYRTARGAFESFDCTLSQSGQTLGLSNTYIFWRIRMPACRQGILAGTVLAFARALGEYGATSMLIGYTPGKTATISTTVYQLWRTNDDAGAFFWVMINLAISTVVLLTVNLLESKQKVRAKG